MSEMDDAVLLALSKARHEAREMYLAAGMRNVYGLNDEERLAMGLRRYAEVFESLTDPKPEGGES